MKKIFVSFVAIIAVSSSAWAAETMNSHDQVNNAQAPAHQMMKNSTSAEQRDMTEKHEKMMKSRQGATDETAKSFSKMSEHEKAAVVHEKANNGQSSIIHQQQAERHRSQVTQN